MSCVQWIRSGTLRSDAKEMSFFSSCIFILYYNWSNERINKQTCGQMERKSQSFYRLLFGTFQNRSSKWFQPLLWSRLSFSGWYKTETQVSNDQRSSLGLGNLLKCFHCILKSNKCNQQVNNGPLINMTWNLILINWYCRDFPGGAVVRICLPMQGTRVPALVREDPTCCRATKPVRHNYWAALKSPWATSTEPVCLEPVLRNERSHHNEKPAHHNEE